MINFIVNPKGVYKLYRITDASLPTSLINEDRWEYIAAVSIEDVIEAWRVRPGVGGRRGQPTHIELVCPSLMIVRPD